MSSIKYPYNDNGHRDLYLEILKKAEMEADKALVQLIMKRLGETGHSPSSVTKDGCRVFAFPEASPSSIGANQDNLFWKNSQFWQDLVQFMAVLSVSISWFIFFCNLITYHTVK